MNRLTVHPLGKYGYVTATRLDDLWYFWLEKNRQAEQLGYENKAMNLLAEMAYDDYQEYLKHAEFQANNRPLFEIENRREGVELT
jgi:hypothetical protein